MYTKKAKNIQFVVLNRGEMVKRKQGLVYHGLKKREVIVYDSGNVLVLPLSNW